MATEKKKGDASPPSPVGQVKHAEQIHYADKVTHADTVHLVGGENAGKAQQAQQSESALTTHGQRRINLIWEVTQATIAIIVTTGTLCICATLTLRGNGTAATAFLLLSNAFFMIVTAYFQRTNHTRVGGTTASGADKDHR